VNPQGGGPIEGIKQMAAVNTAARHSVEIVSMDAPEDPWVADCPVKVHALGPARLKYGFSRKMVPWLQEHRSNYDAVIVNGLWQDSSLAVWRALRKTNTPYFVFPHGMLDPWFKRAYPLKHLKKWLYWPWGEYRVLRDARAVFFTSEEEKSEARKSFWLYRCNEVVVNYGTAVPEGNPEVERAAARERFPELDGKRIILFLGRIHEKKGCDLLIRAFAKTAATDDSVRLVFAGPDQTGWADELRAEAVRLGISDRIVWTGMIMGVHKWGMLRIAEAFILPSHQENFGIAVAEALACGTPVLISNKVNIWREVLGDDAGLVENDDEAGTVRLISRWLALPAEKRAEMRTNAERCFESNFEVTRAAETLVKLVKLHGYGSTHG
jgi:glycosyltransferase involved in cell wall biosynthesis